MITEFLTIGGDGPALAADITRPDLGAPIAGVVVCHPPPAYGGTRESHIVRALVGAFVARGMAALTFDRHVGPFLLRDGDVVRLRPWAIRWTTPGQLDAMAAAAGLTLEAEWSDWEGAAFDQDSVNRIAIYRA